MKGWGLTLAITGVICGLLALNMDTSVETGGETFGSGSYSVTVPRGRVNNLGLMDQRRNYLGVSGVAILAGVLLYGFGSLSGTAERVAQPRPDAPNAPGSKLLGLRRKLHEGEDLSPDDLIVLVDQAQETPEILTDYSRRTGNTLLHLLAAAGMREDAERLLALGASATLGNNNGRRPHDLADDASFAAMLAGSIGRKSA